METTTERLVSSDEESSEAATEVEIFPTELELAAAAVESSNTGFANAGEEAVPKAEAVESDKPQGPPAGYEGTPPELWPDANGNPPQLTEALMRKLRGKYFTVKHVLLTDCNHKLDMINQPKNHCQTCWWTWFNSHPQLVEVADQFFRTHGKNAMIGMRGKVFVKYFLRFMSTVHHFLEQERLKNDSQSRDANSSTLGTTSTIEEAESLGAAIALGTIDEGGQVESGRISSGLIQQG